MTIGRFLVVVCWRVCRRALVPLAVCTKRVLTTNKLRSVMAHVVLARQRGHGDDSVVSILPESFQDERENQRWVKAIVVYRIPDWF
jgi:hypothetical protein